MIPVFLLLFLFCVGVLPAEEIPTETLIEKIIDESELDTPLMDLTAAPSSIVGGVVNAITGNYFESECDLVIPGTNPLVLQRFFTSGGPKAKEANEWHFNLPGKIEVFESDKARFALLKEHGASFLFKGDLKEHTVSLELLSKIFHYGVTNCTSGRLSSRHNLKNKKVHFTHHSKVCKLFSDAGQVLSYSLHNDEYLPKQTSFPNGYYQTFTWKKGNITRMTAFGADDTFFSDISFLYSKGGSDILSAESFDGRHVSYNYEKGQIKSVIKENGPNVEYEYKRGYLIKKSLPNNRFLEVQYYKMGDNQIGQETIALKSHDSRIGRVSALYAPVGVDASPVLIWKFKYNLNKDKQTSKPIGGDAEVFDALGHRKTYSFSDEHRLNAICHFLDNGQVYRTEKMKWGSTGDLITRGLEDNKGELQSYRKYRYNDDGDPTSETFYGNLSGYAETPTSEKFVKNYTYTSKGRIESEDDGRKKIVYKYYSSSDLVKLKLIYDKDIIRERIYFVYDAKGTLIYESIDNGNSSDIANLSGVTERRIKKISPTPLGLPKVIEECFLNLSTGQEELLIRKENEFTQEGFLSCQRVYDKNGNYCYSLERSYDAWGHVLQEIDPLGQITTYQYDQNGNLIFKQTPNPNYHTLLTYDYSNRLIREEEVYGSHHLIKTYSYDYNGNRIKATDIFGHTTNYRYDEFNRLVEKINPAILGKFGFYQPIDKVSYDIFNNPTAKTDSNHFTTKIKYTSWGKPYEISYPDGSYEKSVYNLDGTLAKVIDVNGTYTCFTYDYNNRKIKEETFSDGILLSIQTWIYNAFHLIAEIDPMGFEKTYAYDYAGRLASVKYGDTELRYIYDALSREAEVWELYGPGKYRKTLKTYDNLNRLVQKKIIDELGNIHSLQSYAYDCDNNKTQEVVHTDQGKSCTQIQFNPQKKPIKITQPNGAETRFFYRYDYQNEYGQTVFLEEEIDPNGNVTTRIMDACGRLAREERKDSLGNILKKTSFIHDGEGNLIQRIEDCIISGICKKQVVTEFQYDARNRQVAIIEALADPLQKITKKKYNLTGELAKVIKPDGVILNYSYDLLGRLVDLHSSDGTIHYLYTYDLNGNIIKAEDPIHQHNIQRNFDQNNRMILENYGLQFIYQYDSLGRMTKCILPDQTPVYYQYNATHLTSVSRNNHAVLYKYGLSGRLSQAYIPNGMGTITYTYDINLRPQKISSPYWSEHISRYDPSGNILQINQTDTKDCHYQFSYDSLNDLTGESGYNYAFDSLQNRIRKNDNPYTINSLNQLQQQSHHTYYHDSNGNLTKKINQDQKITYQYDALDRLTTIQFPDKKIEYSYDSFHRRLSKTTHKNGQKEKILYAYQGEIEIGTYFSGKPLETRIIGQRKQGDIGATAFIEIQGQTFIPLHDYRGNIVALLDFNNKNIREYYRYTAYGEEQIFDGQGNPLSHSINPWRFSSKRTDAETNWCYFGRRYYDPEIGRWTTPDPLGFEDGFNLYCFVRNRPLLFVDPDGMFIKEIFKDFMLNHYENWLNSFMSSCVKAYEEDEDFTPIYSKAYTVEGKKSDRLKIMYINGIFNSFAMSATTSERISQIAGGCEVRGVYNVSYAIPDLFRAATGLFGIPSCPVKILQDEWLDFFNSAHNSKILVNAHSEGVIHVRNALETFDPELRKRILVIAIAPACFINKNLCGDVVHLESDGDFVQVFDTILGGRETAGPIVRLKAHPDAPWFDHFVDSPTFKDLHNFHIQQAVQQSWWW